MFCLIIDSNLRPEYAAAVKKILDGLGIGFAEGVAEDVEKHPEADFVLILGGDGSVLAAAGHALRADKPILAVNHGRLGYLSQLECGEASLLAGIRDGFVTDSRMTATATLLRGGAEAASFTALNEISVTKGGLSRLIDLTLCADGNVLGTYRADGIIVSTPTGSTAYNLSAGGPVIDNALEALTVCPVCPHLPMGQRALVLSPQTVIEITLSVRPGCEAFLTADGRDFMQLYSGDTVRVVKGDRYQKFVRIKENAFYDALKNKLMP